jgi:competence protein ComEC
VVVLGVVLLYVLLTGVRPGAVRAALMAGVFCGGIILLRPADMVNTLSFSALIILLLSPAQLFEPGFQLTFTAVAGIYAFYTPLHQGLLKALLPDAGLARLTPSGRRRALLVRATSSALAVSASAWLAVAPLLALYFHLVTPYAVLLSVVMFPVVAALVLVGFLYLLVSLASSTLAGVMAPLLGGLAWVQRGMLAGALKLPAATVYVAAPSLAFLLCYYGYMAAVRWGWVSPRLKLQVEPLLSARETRLMRLVTGGRLLVVAVLLTSAFLLRPVLAGREAGLAVSVFDVGHGLSVLLKLPNGSHLLYDAGGGSTSYDAGANMIAPALWTRGLPRIDALVLSHNHWDHVSGVPALLDRFPVRHCFVSRFFGDSELGSEALQDLRAHGVSVEKVQQGDCIALDDEVLIRVLNPPKGPVGQRLSTNEASIALLVEYRSRRIVLLADVTGDWLDGVLEQVPAPVELVQIPHHGLPDVDLQILVDQLRPRWAIISASSGKRQRAAADLLTQAGVRALTTYRHGAVTARFSPAGTTVSCYRPGVSIQPMNAEGPVQAPHAVANPL